jgi:hypothetical protein
MPDPADDGRISRPDIAFVQFLGSRHSTPTFLEASALWLDLGDNISERRSFSADNQGFTDSRF